MNVRFIEEAKNLVNSLSVIEERHLLELFAVQSGFKNVMRIHMANMEEYQILKSFCERNSLHLDHSKFRLKLSWTNEIGDRFYEDVPWEDNTADEFIAYITKNDTKSLMRAIMIEVEGSHIEAGLLYGYPECCCKNYEIISNGEEWIDVLSRNSKGIFFSPWANKLAYLVYGYTLFPDYFPCSYQCEPTIELSKKYFSLGLESGLKDFVQMQLGFMSSTYLVAENSILSFSEWFIDGANYIHLNLEKMTFFGLNPLAKYSEDWIKIQLPKQKDYCYWHWEDKKYRIYVFTDDPSFKH
jgi:hypothetical protein